MEVALACIAGEEIFRQWNLRGAGVEALGHRPTPFGDSCEIYLVSNVPAPYYLMPRHGAKLAKAPPWTINSRANIYALKELGVRAVLAWAPGGAITHDVAVGDLIVLGDVLDQTFRRDKTFFEHSPLGFLRQFPVFCSALRRETIGVLDELSLRHVDDGTVAVTEGPRLETPAEVRLLNHVGVDFVTHTLVPEMFLTKELQLCYAAVLYVVNYAETGSRHRPFAQGGLFGRPADEPEAERLAAALGSMSQIVSRAAESVSSQAGSCECGEPMRVQAAAYGLSKDWRSWFDAGS